jgi:alpha-ketoglutarate-dependent taurine dioxygenase
VKTAASLRSSRYVPLTPRIGARVNVSKADITRPGFADECLEQLERYGVLLFPKLNLNDEEQVAFTNRLGTIIPQGPLRPDGTRDPVFKITLDTKENPSAAEYLKATILWHIDGLMDDGPPARATMLSGKVLPKSGGQTEFCNAYAAYDDLTPEEQQRFDKLQVMHSLVAANRRSNPDTTPAEAQRWRERAPPKQHPLVWKHRSGRKSLVLGATTDYIVGMPEQESQALIDRLSAFATRREIVYRHEWSVGDLLIWDNCGVMHRVLPYAADSGRMMHRTVLYGVEHTH